MPVRTLRLVATIAIAVQAVSSNTPAASRAAQPQYRSGIDLVEIAVLARDDSGRPVTDLRAADLEVLEDGVRQEIAALNRVSLPIHPIPSSAPEALRASRDVATNDALGDARIFVLVLDALHIAPQRLPGVKRFARQFIEQHVGPADLAAVFSPGAAPGATEDFTTDRLRLLAAVDQFTATKLTSATVERDEEERWAALTGVLMHGGKDPSDGERVGRVRSLTRVLQALAGHLDRSEGRRKALLLFSEGIDYDTGDVMGQAQRDASEVVRAIEQAAGALMRSNVALYAIDPRALSTAAGEMLEAPVHRQFKPDATISPLGVDAEHAASIQSLRHLAESTGGFAAVTSNDTSHAFARIVEESSEYYIVGYTPARQPKPGESRSISVRTSRPGVRLTARKGYVVPKSERHSEAAPESEPEPEMLTLAPPRRGGSRTPANLTVSVAASATAPAPALLTLLASPLPKGGLPLRVQAIPFSRGGRKGVVQLVVEVLGGALEFTDRGGRSEERIEVALITVDDKGRAGNGRSARIDLRLPPDELQRVRATGVRWLSRLELPPGRHQIRVAARAVRTGATGLVTQTIDLARHDARQLSMSGVTLTSLPASIMITKGNGWLETSLETPPSASRRFVAGDQVTAAVELYVPAGARGEPDVVGELDVPGGQTLRAAGKVRPSRADSRIREVAFAVDTGPLRPGQYVFRVIATGTTPPGNRVERVVPFEIVQPAIPVEKQP